VSQENKIHTNTLAELGGIMENKGIFKTQTTQARSWALLDSAIKNLYVGIGEPETEDNASLMFTVLCSLNSLYEKLNRLNSVIERRIEELNVSRENKEESSPYCKDD
jgi:hypothetical protein